MPRSRLLWRQRMPGQYHRGQGPHSLFSERKISPISPMASLSLTGGATGRTVAGGGRRRGGGARVAIVAVVAMVATTGGRRGSSRPRPPLRSLQQPQPQPQPQHQHQHQRRQRQRQYRHQHQRRQHQHHYHRLTDISLITAGPPS